MRDFLLLWVSSIVASIFMGVASELRLYKDACMRGYYIKSNRLVELQRQLLDPKELKRQKMMYLIPIVNIFYAISNADKISQIREMSFESFFAIDAVEKLDDDILEKFKQKPTLFNSLKCSLQMELRSMNAEKEKEYKERMKNETEDFKQYVEGMVKESLGESAKVEVLYVSEKEIEQLRKIYNEKQKLEEMKASLAAEKESFDTYFQKILKIENPKEKKAAILELKQQLLDQKQKQEHDKAMEVVQNSNDLRIRAQIGINKNEPDKEEQMTLKREQKKRDE